MRYSAYNLSIDSQLALPELLPDDGGRGDDAADVAIVLRPVAADGLPGGRQLGPFLWADRRSLWLHVPHVARFLVQDGTQIHVDAEPGIDADSIRVFLLGSAFGALLSQRGYLVLHGNAIRIGDQCMVCVGPSGAGKSTLAAGFMQRGYPVLADDVLPVDASGRALPGFPRIKLWRDATDKLLIDTTGLKRIRPATEKFSYPTPSQAAHGPLPVRWIYILDSAHIDAPRIEAISGMQRFAQLRDNTYRLRFLHGMALQPEHLKLCGQLAGNSRLARLTRPRAGFHLERMIDTILADIAGNP
jgi:hypothetical protein